MHGKRNIYSVKQRRSQSIHAFTPKAPDTIKLKIEKRQLECKNKYQQSAGTYQTIDSARYHDSRSPLKIKELILKINNPQEEICQKRNRQFIRSVKNKKNKSKDTHESRQDGQVKNHKGSLAKRWSQLTVDMLESSIQVAESKLLKQIRKERQKEFLKIPEFNLQPLTEQTQAADQIEEPHRAIDELIENQLHKRILGKKTHSSFSKSEPMAPRQFWMQLIREQKKLIRRLNPQAQMSTTFSILSHFHSTVDVMKQEKITRPSTTQTKIRGSRSFA